MQSGSTALRDYGAISSVFDFRLMTLDFRLTIGIDASRANKPQKTGVEWYAWHVIQGLKKELPEDIRVVLYTQRRLHGPLSELPKNWTQKILNWPPKRLWTQVRLSIEMLKNPPDVLFIPAHVFPIIHPKKTVMMVHDIAGLTFTEAYNTFERWYSTWSAKHAVSHLWKVITPSEFTKKELQQAFGNACRTPITVIPHGYDTVFKPTHNAEAVKRILATYGVKKPFIMTIGRIEEKKNTKRLIEAYNALREHGHALQLVLVGKPGYGYEEIKATIAQSPYKADIIEPGWVETKDVPRLLHAAEALVFPSLYEGFGIPMLEAMASGTPVIASKGSSLEEVGGSAAMYVEPHHTKDWTATIEHVLKDKTQRQYMKERGLERVKAYNWERCAKQTAGVIVPNRHS